MKKTVFLVLASLLLLQLPAGSAADKSAAPALLQKADPRVELAAKMPGTKPEDLRATPVPGLYELTRGAEVSYVSADGKYVLTGDLFKVTEAADFPNLTETRRRELRTRLIDDVPESDMIVYGPKDSRYTITVFTDVDCAWCRRLHSQIADYNRLGVRVRYLAWPRSGPATESWVRAENVWCAANKTDALSRAKRGEAVKAASCSANPVQREWDLGRELGIRGTPGLILPDCELVPGYLPPADLLKHLQAANATR